MDDNIIWAVVSVLFSGCALPVIGLAWRKFSSKSSDIDSSKSEPEVEVDERAKETEELSYKAKIGIRHRDLRVNLAGFTLANMSQIYGLEEISILEEYESGVKELPRRLIKIAIEYFNLKADYFDPEVEPQFPFKTVSSSNYNDYISHGYKPYIMCSPNERDSDLYAYIYLYRENKGLHQMVKSSDKARFKSGDGGKRNVERLIHQMKIKGYDQDDAIVAHVDQEDWKSMESNCFYKKIRGYSIDFECMDIFDRWFKDYEVYSIQDF